MHSKDRNEFRLTCPFALFYDRHSGRFSIPSEFLCCPHPVPQSLSETERLVLGRVNIAIHCTLFRLPPRFQSADQWLAACQRLYQLGTKSYREAFVVLHKAAIYVIVSEIMMWKILRRDFRYRRGSHSWELKLKRTEFLFQHD